MDRLINSIENLVQSANGSRQPIIYKAILKLLYNGEFEICARDVKQKCNELESAVDWNGRIPAICNSMRKTLKFGGVICSEDSNKNGFTICFKDQDSRVKSDISREKKIVKNQLGINNESNYKTVKHMALVKGWESMNNEVDGPITLILGSFNPYFPTSKTDFYYGRIAKAGKGNQFWKSIGRLIHDNEDYFQNNSELKLDAMKEFKFIFMDLIDSIKFSYSSQEEFEKYEREKIYKDFSDSKIWALSCPTYKVNTIERTYNKRVLEHIKTKGSIKQIINTLGRANGDLLFVPKGDIQWGRFRSELIKVCQNKFDPESESPSAFAKCSREEIDNWIRKKVLRI